jgi:guanylate kinase
LHTTRTPRPGQADGVDYYFTTRAQFERDIADNKFLEHCEVHGDLLCGNPLSCGVRQICILDVNIDGAIAISKTDFKSLIIFRRPISLEALEDRLRGRGTEAGNSVLVRTETAMWELRRREEHLGLWNLDIVNSKLENRLATIRKALTELSGFDPMASIAASK